MGNIKKKPVGPIGKSRRETGKASWFWKLKIEKDDKSCVLGVYCGLNNII